MRLQPEIANIATYRAFAVFIESEEFLKQLRVRYQEEMVGVPANHNHSFHVACILGKVATVCVSWR